MNDHEKYRELTIQDVAREAIPFHIEGLVEARAPAPEPTSKAGTVFIIDTLAAQKKGGQLC